MTPAFLILIIIIDYISIGNAAAHSILESLLKYRESRI